MDIRESLVFASLLHDVGRFAYLANAHFFDTIQHTKEKQGFYHLVSYEFIKKYFPEISEQVRNLVLNLNSPSTYEEKILAIANILSGAQIDELSPSDETDEISIPMSSIFSELKQNGGSESVLFYPIELNLQDKNHKNLFFSSREKDIDKEIVKKNYREMWDKFIKDIEKINIYSIPTLYSLLFKYTWRIPYINDSSDVLHNDISLFEHSRLTSALSVSLYDNGFSEEKINNIYNYLLKNREAHNITDVDENMFSIIGGDISGIQKFIYQITTKGAAKALKGRSFYIQLLNHIIVKYLIKELNLFETNIIYQGGGQFYIISSSENKKISDNLDRNIKKIENILFSVHKEDLGIVISNYDFSFKNLLNIDNKNYNDIWSNITRNIGLSKGKKFKNVILENPNEFFGPVDSGGKKILCSICGNEIGENISSNNKERKCNQCKSFEVLADDLIKNKFMIITDNVYTPKDYNEIFGQFGFNVIFTNTPKRTSDKSADMIYILNSSDFGILKNTGFNEINLYFVGKETPMDKESNNILPFDKMILNKKGLHRLAIARADIDNLGYFFSRGFSPKKTTFTRTASLSINLKVYFEYYINELIEEKYKNKIYLIYSGGDDVCVVGFWSDVIDFIYDLNKNFNRFSDMGNNRSLTLSAGIALFEEKQPLYKISEIAGQLEEQSKLNYDISTKKEKNSITLFGKTMFWEEFKEIDRLKNKLIELSTDTGNPNYKSIYQRLMNIYNIYIEEAEKIKRKKRYNEVEINWTRWRWMLRYILRNESKTSKDKDEKNADSSNIINDIITELLENKSGFYLIKNLDVAIKWADYLTR